jgi:undecaprenyl diphosphate synthase
MHVFLAVVRLSLEEDHLDEALEAFSMRQRRFGKVSTNDNLEKLSN